MSYKKQTQVSKNIYNLSSFQWAHHNHYPMHGKGFMDVSMQQCTHSTNLDRNYAFFQNYKRLFSSLFDGIFQQFSYQIKEFDLQLLSRNLIIYKIFETLKNASLLNDSLWDGHYKKWWYKIKISIQVIKKFCNLFALIRCTIRNIHFFDTTLKISKTIKVNYIFYHLFFLCREPPSLRFSMKNFFSLRFSDALTKNTNNFIYDVPGFSRIFCHSKHSTKIILFVLTFVIMFSDTLKHKQCGMQISELWTDPNQLLLNTNKIV